MADKLPPSPPPADEPEIADVGGLLDDPETEPSTPSAGADPSPSADVDPYELEDEDPPSRPDPPPPPKSSAAPAQERSTAPTHPNRGVKDAPIRPPRRPSKKADPDAELDALAEESTVDPTWSRGGEWGATFVLLAIVGCVVLGVVYALMSAGQVGLGFLVLAGGLAVLVLLSYPIAVTLEVPVRMTPERALKDYYAALSHHFPHYRRMWLLLSDLGRDSHEFASPSEFREYWRERIAGLKSSNHVNKITPLDFEVVEFHAEKSAGKDATAGRASVTVRPRGGEPISSTTYAAGFAKGPDRMWYLNRGDLPKSKP